MLKRLLFISLIFLFSSLLAEGIKEFGDLATQGGGFYLTRLSFYTPFGLYDASEEYQIKVDITSPDDMIYLGMNIGDNPNFPFRILDPSGNIVYTSTVPGSGQTGFISNFTRASNGPNINGRTNGYEPIILDPDTIGSYVIEFNPTGNSSTTTMSYFDVTVTNPEGEIELGRLHSKSWQLSAGNFNNPVDAKVYPYNPTGVLFEVDFNGIQPYAFTITFNSTGTDTTGNILLDRQSKKGKYLFPEFEVFLNPPSEELYPITNKEFNYTASIKRNDCSSTLFCLEFESTSNGVIDGFVDFNGNYTYEPELGDLLFSDLVDSTKSTCIEWDGMDGNGNPVGNREIKMVSQFGSGVMHLPLYDIEHNRNGYIIRTLKPSNLPDPTIYWDDQLITAGSTLGSPKVNLSGCQSNASGGCHLWTGRGDQTGNDASRTLNQETINTWWYAEAKYDTLSFDYVPNYPVNLSFDPDSLIKQHPKVCAGDTVDFFVFNNGTNHYDTSNYHYYWSSKNDFSDTLLIDANRLAYQANENTMIHLLAAFKINPDCISKDSIEINVVQPIQGVLEIDPLKCFDNTNTASITYSNGGQENTLITWEDTSNIHSATRSDLLPYTEYTIRIADENYSQRCAFDTSFQFGSLRKMKIESIVLDSTFCYDSTGNIAIEMEDKEVDYSYSWNNDAFIKENGLDNLIAGFYSVVVKDDSTLCQLDTIIPVLPIPFEIESTTKPEACSNSDGEISIEIPSDKLQIIWENNSTQKTRENLSAGEYQVEVFSNLTENCLVIQDFTISNIGQTFVIDTLISEATWCYDSTGKAEISMEEYPEANFVYSWNNGVFTEQSKKENLLSGNYSVTIMDLNSRCKVDTSLFIPALPFTMETEVNPELCGDSTGSIQLILPSDKIQITWETIGFENVAFRDGLTSGNYKFSAFSTLNPNVECEVNDSLVISNEIHLVKISQLNTKDASCISASGRAEIIVEPLNSTTNYTYQWSDLGNEKTNLSIRESLAPNNYTVTVFEQGTLCQTDTSFTINSKGFDFETNATETICTSNNGSAEVLVIGDTSTFDIEWLDTGDESFRRTNLSSGVYNFRITSPLDPSCVADTFVVVDQVYNVLNADFLIDYSRPLDQVFLEDSLTFINTSTPKTPIVIWRGSEGSTGTGDIYKQAYSEMGDYRMTLYIEDEYGCFDETSKSLRVLQFNDCGIAMPNAFSPNEDGINDDIGIIGYADEVELRIYNRWGSLVYRSFDINERWKGDYKSEDSPINTYIYQLDYICKPIKGELIKEFLMGEITLIR